MTKVYKPRRSGSEAPVFEFTMIFVRDGVDEHHTFEARPDMDWKDTRGIVPLIGGSSKDDNLISRAVPQIDRMIRRALRNDDGTPEKWKPNIVREEGRTWFTDPNGDHIEGDEIESLLPVYLAFNAGSSRRRWVHLMDVDDDVTIEPEQVMDLLGDLTEASGKDRSPKSAASSG